MNRSVYSLLMYLLSPVIWGYLLIRAIKSSDYRDGFAQRLGLGKAFSTSNIILVHCASVGETRAAEPLIKHLLQQYRTYQILVTTTTPTGKKAVEDLFGEQVEHRYLPIDWKGSCRRLLKKAAPHLVILMETELWPNFLSVCGEKNIPVLLANARLSTRSTQKYLKYPKLTKDIFSEITIIAAQYESDRQNYLALGVEPVKITLVGNIKFDLEISAEAKVEQKLFRRYWVGERPAWVAASIHPDEFSLVLTVHQQLLKHFPDLLLIAVPRHPEKFDLLADVCKQQSLNMVRRSENQKTTANTQVIVGDSLGEMLLYCAAAKVAFVGGSLIVRGGHNPLEPVACGLPVIMGPHYYNFSDVCELLIERQLLNIANSEVELFTMLSDKFNTSLQCDDKENQTANQTVNQHSIPAALAFMNANRGCVKRLVNLAEQLIQK